MAGGSSREKGSGSGSKKGGGLSSREKAALCDHLHVVETQLNRIVGLEKEEKKAMDEKKDYEDQLVEFVKIASDLKTIEIKEWSDVECLRLLVANNHDWKGTVRLKVKKVAQYVNIRDKVQEHADVHNGRREGQPELMRVIE